jgi:hypothetical protein
MPDAADGIGHRWQAHGERLVQRGRRTHDRGGLLGVRVVVATDVGGLALDREKLVDDRLTRSPAAPRRAA